MLREFVPAWRLRFSPRFLRPSYAGVVGDSDLLGHWSECRAVGYRIAAWATRFPAGAGLRGEPGSLGGLASLRQRHSVVGVIEKTADAISRLTPQRRIHRDATVSIVGLSAFEVGIFPIGDEHMPRFVRDRQRGLGMGQGGLGCHSAGPKHRDFPRAEGDRIAIIRLIEVANADGRRVAKMHRGPVGARKA